MKDWKIVKVLFTGFEYKGRSVNPLWLIVWRLLLWPFYMLACCLVSLTYLLALEKVSAMDFFEEYVKFW